MNERLSRLSGKPIRPVVRRRNFIRTSSAAEREFVNHAIAEGWRVLKSGWPDFILVGGDGSTRFVEVKRPRQGLKKNQTEVARILARRGIRVERCTPGRSDGTGASPIERFSP